jgi:hypothetical protein
MKMVDEKECCGGEKCAETVVAETPVEGAGLVASNEVSSDKACTQDASCQSDSEACTKDAACTEAPVAEPVAAS